MASEMSSSMHSRRLGPHGTPESEFSIECFQNYTAPEVFVQGLAGIVNQGDVEVMIRAQKQMLQRFEKTNEMLLNCNALSASRLKTAGEDFKKHIKVLNEMKKDLDYVFKKIRNIKTKISTQYPQAYADAQPQRNSFAEEVECDDDITPTTSKDITQIIPPIQIATGAIPKTGSMSATNSPNLSKTNKKLNSLEKSKSNTTVEYVKMDQSPENNGKNNGNATGNSKRRSLQSNNSSSTENSNNSNDSSDCTSDTG